MFDKLKMMNQARSMQKKMEGESFTEEFQGVEIVINGKQEVKDISINNEELLSDKSKLEGALKDALNNAVKKSQTVMAEKMKEEMGGMFGM